MDPKLLDRLTYLLVAAAALAAGFLFAPSRAPAPSPAVSQPAVPSLIPPACPGPNCSGSCNPAKACRSPFNVVCPHCRNTIAVQPPCRSTGDLLDEAVNPTAK